MIRALIFDFDGLILDTETPEYETWQELYHEHGCDLPLSYWLQVVGSRYDVAQFNPIDYLIERSGLPLNRAELQKRYDALHAGKVERQPVMPGVLQHIEAAQALGLRLAVASSSTRRWVAGHLTRLGLLDSFDVVISADDVVHIKPAPDLFLAALDALGIHSDEAIVFEDSANGVAAAKAAGIFTVAVPNTLTRHANLSRADLRLASLADISLEVLLQKAQDGHR